MGLLSSIFGGGGSKSESSTSNTDNRAAIGQGGIQLREGSKLVQTDGGAVRAGAKLGAQAINQAGANVRRVLDYSTDTNTRALSFADKALTGLAAAWKDSKQGASAASADTSKIMLVALAAVAAVGIAAAMRKG